MRHLALWVLVLAGCAPELEASELQSARITQAMKSGVQLFQNETFGGNGRTCETCHLAGSGSISPVDIEVAFLADPTGPLFRAIDSDDGTGASFNRMRDDATFRIFIDLPANVVLTADPTADRVELFRGASPVLNNPGLAASFMQDGRNATLQEQALGAINAHFEPGRQPTATELDKLADHQAKKPEFFSSNAMKQWQRTGRPPALPAGNTPEEIRGAGWFDSSTADGVCAHCHSGPYLDQTNGFLQAPLPAGSQFFTAFVSEFNNAGNTVQDFAFLDPSDPLAPPVVVSSPDPGRALITGDPNDANFFRISTVWGAKFTAPYFHDNSAADLQALMDHYQAYFQVAIGLTLTEQDKTDIIAFMLLLE